MENPFPTGEKKDRLVDIMDQMSKFAQQVNELLGGQTQTSEAQTSPENELAICRHARAIVDSQLENPPDAASKSKLIHLRKELTRRIESLESEMRGESMRRGKSMPVSEKVALAGIVGLGVGLTGFGLFLAYERGKRYRNAT